MLYRLMNPPRWLVLPFFYLASVIFCGVGAAALLGAWGFLLAIVYGYLLGTVLLSYWYYQGERYELEAATAEADAWQALYFASAQDYWDEWTEPEPLTLRESDSHYWYFPGDDKGAA